jgi:hypothetical protein
MQFGFSGPSHGSYRAAVMGGAESYGGTDSGMLTFHTQNGYVVSSTPPERMRISSVGNVGIGTTSPSTVLNIASTAPVVRLNPGTNNSTAIEFGVLNAATNAYARIDATNEVNFDTNLRFYTNAVSSTTQVERMRISSEGNIGIGTTSPAYKLEVSGGDAVIRNAFIGLIPSYGSNYTSFSHTSRSAVNKYSFLSGNAGDTYVNASNGQSIFFRQENIDQMTILSNGNVGIASVAPAFALDVNGIVRATALIETSAKKYKTNIQNLEPQLNKVLQLQPVTFDWKEKKGERPSIGLIADDVINIYPEFVVKNKENEIEGIDYSKLTAVLIQSVKELKEIIDRQQEQINALLTK